MAKVVTYRGFKIESLIDDGHEIFRIYTEEEWGYGEGLRSYEWDACTYQEAKDFIDSYDTSR
ncbi:hypothetical protein [Paenibacillus sp. HB172176]|uniref:hypothetical protein n=1 Tax=Paenibacillus sp. HB172176 TaxID=2493690 RepID=UPI00143A5555|nr:hypothetical protein [Paenibacillus sp. HB172176]